MIEKTKIAIPATNLAFDELIEFLASSPSAQEIISYRPPERLQTRMSELLEKNRQDTLTSEEHFELDEFLRMNRFMSRLQAKAKRNYSRHYSIRESKLGMNTSD